MSLGRRWTTRIIILPGATLVRRGPYRFFPHPNYAVAKMPAEIALLPLVWGLWQYALVFTLLNAGVLFIRIRAENAALSSLAPAGSYIGAIQRPNPGTDMQHRFTQAQLETWRREGGVVLEKFFTPDEVGRRGRRLRAGVRPRREADEGDE